MDPRIDILFYRPWANQLGLEDLSRFMPNLQQLAIITVNIQGSEVWVAPKLRIGKFVS
jgi:hypothetical protein